MRDKEREREREREREERKDNVITLFGVSTRYSRGS